VRASGEAEFREYVAARLHTFRRTAYFVCRDWHTADDVVAVVLDRLYRHWSRRSAIANLDAYVGGMLARAAIDEKRRPWRREHPAGDDGVLNSASTADGDGRLLDRMTLDGYLAQLGPRRRAVLVLRFYCDLSVEETAEVLGISVGTVKSQAARGLETLRAMAVGANQTGRSHE
jgi:RNA polymerase sigma-70 factor (sigma-E family)